MGCATLVKSKEWLEPPLDLLLNPKLPIYYIIIITVPTVNHCAFSFFKLPILSIPTFGQ